MIQYLPMIASLAQMGYGAIKEGQQRREMRAERSKWNAQNEALFNKDYYADYTQQAEAQNVIRQMRDEMKKENKVDENVAAVTGASPEAMNARKERRNKAMTNLVGGIHAQSTAWKERAKDRYLNRKTQLQEMEYGDMQDNAISANNMLYNGINGLASTDWAGILGGGNRPDPTKIAAKPLTGVSVNKVVIPETMKTASSVFNVK